VVWFGEMLPREASDAAMEMLSRCEVLIVAGTSAVVAPASGYAAAAKRHGARVIEVNPDETPVSGICDATFRGKSGEVLPALLG
jgi:NAD-dependent SIR2 family protein deacetylase